MNAVSENMLIDVVDDQDKSAGVTKRKEVFERRVNFRVVHLFLFNRYNELLLQQLSFGRDRHPGEWGSSVAGYLFAGESYAEAATRRLSEELRVRNADLHLIGKTAMLDRECKKFISVFVGSAEGPFQFDHAHIEALEFRPISDIVLLQRNRERIFTPTFLHVLDFYRQHNA
jgi:isopentenyldiphosphate isomerase